MLKNAAFEDKERASSENKNVDSKETKKTEEEIEKADAAEGRIISEKKDTKIGQKAASAETNKHQATTEPAFRTERTAASQHLAKPHHTVEKEVTSADGTKTLVNEPTDSRIFDENAGPKESDLGEKSAEEPTGDKKPSVPIAESAVDGSAVDSSALGKRPPQSEPLASEEAGVKKAKIDLTPTETSNETVA
eukprot:TRINITY_DN5542_c1_g1_i1.p2 TRINITY_DN5542_c1_g1~~TRINITY_DN5542_c1_g1_i1.p2  ORF type:complete len:192 (-),score=89.30 TRINITY_DN5542_c1_g1_i1:1573-2148(-)